MAEPFPAEGLSLERARRRVLEALAPLPGLERLPLEAALGRVSAVPLQAAEAVPGFAAAILDGYAVADASPPAIGQAWRLVGRSAAGAPYPGVVGEREAVRILTGAPVPAGARRVIAQELVQKVSLASADGSEALGILLASPAGPASWIRDADEEVAAGVELLAAGQRLGPADLGRLAACGVATLEVRPRPRIGLLVCGDELVPAGDPRGPGQIWESNGVLLAALLERLGHPLAERRLVADDPAALGVALEELGERCDVLVSSGGVSAGDADWIRPLLAERGTVQFWKLFLKPGRPFAFGALAGRPFFALPGNPVAAAVTALQLLRPALQRLEGEEPRPLPRLRVRLAARLRRGRGRPELARARLEVAPDGTLLARLEGSQASSRIGSLQGADLLLEIPPELGVLEAGTELWAQLLRLPVL